MEPPRREDVLDREVAFGPDHPLLAVVAKPAVQQRIQSLRRDIDVTATLVACLWQRDTQVFPAPHVFFVQTLLPSVFALVPAL
jgi:hypothetical protein